MKGETKALLLVMAFAAALAPIPHAACAQGFGAEVCLVYFTSYSCGDDCRLTDTFMDGQLNEYSGNLTSINYYIDASQANADVFQAYRRTYNLPDGVPIVLFGKDDYLFGIDEIYDNTESKILDFMDKNGTNCPLDSGYVPPAQVRGGGPASLPGSPQVETGEPDEESGEDDDGEEDGDGGEAPPAGGQNPVMEIFEVDEPVRESLLSLAIIIIILIVAGVAIFFVWQKMGENS
jgi:hypothetical protein